MAKRRIIIDTDPGIDDAVALAIALFAEELDVCLITTVAGNVSIEKVTKNVLQLLAFYEKKVPVAIGASRPLIKEMIDASGVHGETGMGAYAFPKEDTSLLLQQHAVEAMRETILGSDEKITLVPIAPLTNIALLLRMYPEVKENIEEIVMMGGSIARGNSGIYSEFNIDADPEAAHIVFESGIPITMATLDVGLKALVYPEDSEQIKNMNKVGEMFYELFKAYRGGSFKTGLKMYDSCAIAYLLKPELFEVQEAFVGVEIKGEFSKGATCVDLRNYLKREINARVAVDIDPIAFKQWFMAAIQKCNV